MSVVKRAIFGVVGEHLSAHGTIVGVTQVEPRFRLIELQAASLVNATWRPGDKLQLNTGDWDLRTYTPLALDPRAGTLKLLAFVREERTPASRWAQSVKVGDGCQFRGPSHSIEVAQSSVLFGDETSVGLALALGGNVKAVLEVGGGLGETLRDLGLGDVALIERRPDFGHIPEVARVIRALASPRVLLTGHAQSIQHLRAALRPLRTSSKAYWSTGKSGLD